MFTTYVHLYLLSMQPTSRSSTSNIVTSPRGFSPRIFFQPISSSRNISVYSNALFPLALLSVTARGLGGHGLIVKSQETQESGLGEKEQETICLTPVKKYFGLHKQHVPKGVLAKIRLFGGEGVVMRRVLYLISGRWHFKNFIEIPLRHFISFHIYVLQSDVSLLLSGGGDPVEI